MILLARFKPQRAAGKHISCVLPNDVNVLPYFFQKVEP